MAHIIKEAKSDEEILSCWTPMILLRPHLKHPEFLSRVRQQQDETYRLMYVADEVTGNGTSILGFRTINFLFSGKTLYIDDVSTSPEARGKGQGGALLDWTLKYAKDNGYDTVSLDSGFTRNDAHRLYLNKGFKLYCHHFSILDLQQQA